MLTLSRPGGGFRRCAIVLICLLPLSAAEIVVTSGSRVVIDDREPLALRKAAADLSSDLAKTLGTSGARGPSIVVALDFNLPSTIARPQAAEASRIVATRSNVVLTGADTRGAIYAVYEFSRRWLGVDPLWFWTDHPPARRRDVHLDAGAVIDIPPPVFRRRGWFINDEDLLTGWRPGAADGTGISLAAWDRIFEALLRLRGNMIVPGTFIFPDEPQVRAASDRGLIVTQHHIEVLGANTWRWPEDQPYSFAAHPEILSRAWRNSMLGYRPDQEVIWTVGYRGRHDRAFWEDDPGIPPTDEARAATIRRAIDRQLEIVRAARRDAMFIMNAWDEAVPLIEKGLLKLPGGVTLVWPDNGHGVIRDGGRIAKGQGVYYHTAMHNFVANQLTEMVPLERIERELTRAARAGATEYLLVNVSDVRPYPMTTRAVMEIGERGADWSAASYLDRWSREEFGDKAAAAIADYYRAYFAAPGRYGPAEHQTLSDTAYQNYLRFILVSIIKGTPELSARFVRISDWDAWLARVTQAAREAEPRWAAAREKAGKAAALIPPDRRSFFQSHVLTQLAIHEHSNRALLLGAESRIEAAIAELEQVLNAFKAAEYGPWKGFYEGDRFDNVRETLALARAAKAKLQGRPIPAGLRVEALPVDPYHWIKAYQGARRVDVSAR